MSQWTDQQDFVRNVKGAPASILWAFVLSGRTLTPRQLQAATGYSDKPVAKALLFLTERGILVPRGRLTGYSLAGGLDQLPLPFSHRPTVRIATRASYQQPVDKLDGIIPSNDDPGLVEDLDLKQEEINQPDQERRNSVHRLLASLEAVGIVEPASSRFVYLQVVPEMVTAWYWWASAKTWVRDVPAYVVSMLDKHRQPDSAFMDLAVAWHMMGQEAQDLLRVEARGTERGVMVKLPAASGADLFERVGEVIPINAAACGVFLQLVKLGIL